MTVSREELPGLSDEYVLGLLDEVTAGRIDRDLEDDASLVAAVAESRERFLPLDTALEPLPVPAGLWDRVAAALPDRQPARDMGVPPARTLRPRMRAVLSAALAASLGLAVGLGSGFLRFGGTAGPAIIAVLEAEDGTPQAVVEDYGDDTARVRFLVSPDVPPGRSMQVWTKPSEAIGAVSLGLVEAGRDRLLQGPDLPDPVDLQLYEITLEPEGGSPTGRPTGPILGKGLGRVQPS